MANDIRRARRGRGEGSIYKRADGRWVGSYSAGYNGEGKRRRRVVYGESKKEVKDRLRELENEVAAGRPVEVQRITLAEYLDRWIASIENTVAPSTYTRYKCSVEQQIKPHLGSMRLAAIAPLHVEQLYGLLAKAETSPRTRQLAGVTLGVALKHAVRLKLIGSNPVRDIAKPRVKRRELKVWDAAQVGVFLKAAEGDRLEALYVLALAAGLRQGELFGLQWADVDFDGNSIGVQRSLEELNGKHRLKEPKSGRGRRVDLPAFAMKALVRHRAAMLAEGNIAGPVFCDHQGGFLRKGNVSRRSFRPMITKANVPAIRFHDLRHSHATVLLAAGENVKVVSERLGHANIKITLDTYAHVLPTMQKAAADRLQKLLG